MGLNPRHRNRPNRLPYQALEDRRLLAVMINGGLGDDVVDIDYVSENLVNVTLNGDLMENVDVSDGLKINLKDGLDSATIDQNITAEIGVYNVDSLTLIGDNANRWEVGYAVEPPPEGTLYYDLIDLPGNVAGIVNGTIRFMGTNTLTSGGGNDTFAIGTTYGYALSIHGGDGNDKFYFSGATTSTGSITLSAWGSAVRAYGESGFDRFIYKPGGQGLAVGGADFDILDYQQSGRSVQERVTDISDGIWGNGNDRILGASGFNNGFQSYSNHGEDYRFNWIINGDRTTVSDSETGAFVELFNFNSFMADGRGFDRFWVRATVEEISIRDADWIQIGSEYSTLNGNLDNIQHDINIVKSNLKYYEKVGPRPTGSVNYLSPRINQLDQDGTLDPRVIISDASNNTGLVAGFNNDSTISLRRVAQIAAGGFSPTINFEIKFDTLIGTADQDPSAFQPEVIIHGSSTAADYFTFNQTSSATKIYSHGGDDAFMFGGSNKNANARMDNIKGEVSVIAGAGTDRLYLNDRAFDEHVVGYSLSDSVIREQYRYGVGHPSEYLNVDATPYPLRFAAIHVDQSLELVRANGSATQQNQFLVAPSATTKFVIDGSQQSVFNDTLTISTNREIGNLFNNQGSGAWTFGNDAQSVHFYGIENPDNSLLFARLNTTLVASGELRSSTDDVTAGLAGLDDLDDLDNAFESLS